MKDPESPLCEACLTTTKLQHDAEMKASLNRIPGPVLLLVFLAIWAVMLLARLFGAILCGIVAYHYWTAGNADLTLVWVMLSALAIPPSKCKCQKNNA